MKYIWGGRGVGGFGVVCTIDDEIKKDSCVIMYQNVINFIEKCSLIDILQITHPKYIPLLAIADSVHNKIHYFITINFLNGDPEYCRKSKYLPSTNIENETFSEEFEFKNIESIFIKIIRDENIEKTLKHYRKRANKGDYLSETCANCGKMEKSISGERFKRCEKCKKIRYCCKECQIADWENHKKDCKN